jgi:hypothetical protein
MPVMSDQATKQLPESAQSWPDVIRVSVWLVREQDGWQALASEFDIVGQGASEGLALRNLQELVISYLDSCIEDGMSFEEARSPIPLKERLRLELGRLLTPLHHLLHRWVSRDGLIFPLADGQAHC